MKKVSVYTDSSGGRKIIGLGAVVVTPSGSEYPMGSVLRPGCKTSEAEILALMNGLDFFRTVARIKKLNPKDLFLTFLCDSMAAVGAVNGAATLRGDARTYVKNFLEELADLVGKEFSGWTIKHIRREQNKADQAAKQARSRWMRRFRPRSSGP